MKNRKPIFHFIFQALLIISILVFNSCATTAVSSSNKDSNKSRALRSLGYSLYQQGKAREGLVHLLEAEKVDRTNPDLQHELALVYQEIGEYDLALARFKKAVKLKPDFSEAYNNMGVLYSLQGQSEKALECFNKAVSNILYPTPHFAYRNMGLVYFKENQTGKAIEYYLKAIESAPNYAGTYFDLGTAYEKLGRYSDAANIYEKASSLLPASLEPRLSLAKVYIKAGQKNRAVQELNDLIELEPGNPVALRAKEILRELQNSR
jgi:type IV pilus biogenesis/stability protein PilW